jgi:hypothetical protein
MKSRQLFFDSNLEEIEQLPKHFTVTFEEVGIGEKGEVRVILNESKQVGDIINDNAYKNDFYRYHDIFHYSFATLLGWSPCTRAMMKRKRKSIEILDEVEDGARATVTEEALSMIIFNEAKRKNYFEIGSKVSHTTLRMIKEMTENFEVNVRSMREWESAILKAYEIFRLLISNQGGKVEFDAIKRTISFSTLQAHDNRKTINN